MCSQFKYGESRCKSGLPLSRRDACMDAGGRAMHGAIAERDRGQCMNKPVNHVIEINRKKHD